LDAPAARLHLDGYAIWWAARSRDRAAWRAVAIVIAQIAIAVTMLSLGFANGLRAAHAAVGAGVWVAMLSSRLNQQQILLRLLRRHLGLDSARYTLISLRIPKRPGR